MKTFATNQFSQNEAFRKTALWETFSKAPLGAADVGSLDGAHPLLHPFASLCEVLCFEPDETDCRKLEALYAKDNPFAGVFVYQAALAEGRAASRKLYIAKVPTNTSLLQPSPEFIRRYRAEKFEVERESAVATESLDRVIYETPAYAGKPFGEFLKLDTQGSEHEILRGAARTLEERTLAVWCEVEFFEVYAGQKTYADIDTLLRDYGLVLYGLYPHYRSAKLLERENSKTEERLMWADAFFVKDPLDPRSRGRHFSERQIQALVLIAAAAGFYDYALELAAHYFPACPKTPALKSWIEALARVDGEALRADVAGLKELCGREPGKTALHVARFVSKYASNTSADYVPERNG